MQGVVSLDKSPRELQDLSGIASTVHARILRALADSVENSSEICLNAELFVVITVSRLGITQRWLPILLEVR